MKFLWTSGNLNNQNNPPYIPTSATRVCKLWQFLLSTRADGEMCLSNSWKSYWGNGFKTNWRGRKLPEHQMPVQGGRPGGGRVGRWLLSAKLSGQQVCQPQRLCLNALPMQLTSLLESAGNQRDIRKSGDGPRLCIPHTTTMSPTGRERPLTEAAYMPSHQLNKGGTMKTLIVYTKN